MTAHDEEDIFRFLSGHLSPSDHDRIEAHLKACPECSDLVTFVHDFNSTLKAMSPEVLQPATPCPDADTIAAFAEGELDESAAQAVRQHTIFCKECLEEVFLLRRAAAAAGIKSISEFIEGTARWRDFLEKAKDFVIDLGKAYGQGILIGSVRIAAEQPAFAVRGHKVLSSKVLEVTVGGNGYSIELTFAEAGSLSCDIASFRSSVQAPLQVSLRSETGEEIASVGSDDFGKCHFDTPSPLRPGELYVLSLNLKGAEQHIVFRFTKHPS